MFAIFFPEDVHMPCLRVTGPENVHKIVVKVKVGE
jgi:YhcH/YjgK/YiaL family protein